MPEPVLGRTKPDPWDLGAPLDFAVEEAGWLPVILSRVAVVEPMGSDAIVWFDRGDISLSLRAMDEVAFAPGIDIARASLFDEAFRAIGPDDFDPNRKKPPSGAIFYDEVETCLGFYGNRDDVETLPDGM